jgi:hypothetical protein
MIAMASYVNCGYIRSKKDNKEYNAFAADGKIKSLNAYQKIEYAFARSWYFYYKTDGIVPVMPPDNGFAQHNQLNDQLPKDHS